MLSVKTWYLYLQEFSDPDLKNPLAITWATPCDGNRECKDVNDEYGCATPSWLLPVVLFGTGFVLTITLFFHLTKSTSDLIEEIGKTTAADNTFRFDRPFCIAILTEMGEDDEIKKVFNREKNIRGSEKEALCYFKVI